MTAAECLAKAIEAQIGGDKTKSWTQGDSAECIIAMVANETGTEPSDFDDIKPIIRLLCNPSQVLQQLVKDGQLNERKKGERGTSVSITSFLKPVKKNDAKPEAKPEPAKNPPNPGKPAGK